MNEWLEQELEQRVAMDFAHQPVGQLFRRMLFPTLVGMVSMVVLNLTDGAFVGHGAGAEALAAVNIAAPVFTLMTGIGMMFGIGASVIASVHLAQGHVKAARMHCTQALVAAFLLAVVLSALILLNLQNTCRLFGGTEVLLPLASSYLVWIAWFIPLHMLGIVGGFIVRLDGSPRYAMFCTLLATALNIVLDWFFIFRLHWGLEGAAIATASSFSISSLCMMHYVLLRSRTLRICRLVCTTRSAALLLRHAVRQAKAGCSAMLGEAAVSFSIIAGNFVFAARLGEDGVAAYSVLCYCMPVLFMFANAIVQSSQPIVSFAYGAADAERQRQGMRVAVRTALYAGTGAALLLSLGTRPVSGLFLPVESQAYALCTAGMPLFASGGIFLIINVVLVGYMQSIERPGVAAVFTLSRGCLLLALCFILLPELLGTTGIWLAIPAAEALTTLLFCVFLLNMRRETDVPFFR